MFLCNLIHLPMSRRPVQAHFSTQRKGGIGKWNVPKLFTRWKSQELGAAPTFTGALEKDRATVSRGQASTPNRSSQGVHHHLVTTQSPDRKKDLQWLPVAETRSRSQEFGSQLGELSEETNKLQQALRKNFKYWSSEVEYNMPGEQKSLP
ncbi:hypothetical protein FHETE_11415 [Fusarium heterosporum]|uniref:Uncharacterized protein n=1 Tax=Fusarium heterosporum TaxID=42747 RepID=A0A8H5W8L4_FUSHE|nr:hypothetical protein FHETE_11415 [Fusarium heterosporum]